MHLLVLRTCGYVPFNSNRSRCKSIATSWIPSCLLKTTALFPGELSKQQERVWSFRYARMHTNKKKRKGVRSCFLSGWIEKMLHLNVFYRIDFVCLYSSQGWDSALAPQNLTRREKRTAACKINCFWTFGFLQSNYVSHSYFFFPV